MPPAAPASPAPVAPPAPACPVCTKPLVVYAGENPAKRGTGFCPTCGTRAPLQG